MRNVNSHLLEKMDEAVTHYINSHQHGEPVHVDANEMSLNVHDDEGGRVVTIMHQGNFQPQLCRQISVGDQVGESGTWGEELLDPESRLAALVAHLTQNSRTSHHHAAQHKVAVRGDMDHSVMLDGTHLRMFSGQPLDPQGNSIVVELPQLPPLQQMKRSPDPNWFHDKDKNILKDAGVEDCDTIGDVIHHKQSKKSLPHKKRISRKLKRNTNTPQQDIVVINCSDEVQVQEEILPDSFVTAVSHPEHLPEDTHHIPHEMRPIFICQLCGDFFGEEQLKFYHHLKQHYEPHSTIIIENPVPDLGIDKMTNTCIVDNVATLPDSIVELSLENTGPKTMYQSIEKHILYTSSDKTLNFNSNKVQYSMAPSVPTSDVDKVDLYESELFGCVKCNKSFRNKKQCEVHVKEFHSSAIIKQPQMEDMSEFSEPEDLMEGIHVSVDDGDHYLPHLTVDAGQVTQDQHRHWYVVRGGCGGACGATCATCLTQHAQLLSREDVQKILESGVTTTETSQFPENMPEHDILPEPGLHPPETNTARDLHDTNTQDVKKIENLSNESVDMQNSNEVSDTKEQQSQWKENDTPVSEEGCSTSTMPAQSKTEEKKKKTKQFSCGACGRVFQFRNSLLYHALSHAARQYPCPHCHKSFFTTNALKVHVRVHSDDRPYRCTECDSSFRQWSDLQYHKTSLHSNQKNHKCEFCGKDFARKYSLSVHRRIHTGEKNYKCEFCNKAFSASSYKTSHMRTHTGDKPYKCEECGKCFRVAGDMRRHQRIHEKARLQAEGLKPKTKNPVAETTTPPQPPPAKVIKLEDAPVKKNPPRVIKTKNQASKANRKNQSDKKCSSEVTVEKPDAYKFNDNYEPNVAELEHELKSFSKFKEVYAETSKDNIVPPQTYLNSMPQYKEMVLNDLNKDEKINEDRYVVLRPLIRSPSLAVEEKQPFNRTENTDGKMTVFTHVEKVKDYAGSIVANTQALNIGSLDREVVRDPVRAEALNADGTETAFIERLTAMYNISAV